MMPHGVFAWNELMTPDVEAAKSFYERTLGWTFERMPSDEPDMPPYYIARSGEEVVAGLTGVLPGQGDDMPPAWFAYVEVDDVDRRAAAVVAAGGTMLREPFDAPGVGRIAIVQDASGAAIGWMTSEPEDAQG